jgi:hypothetical protein
MTHKHAISVEALTPAMRRATNLCETPHIYAVIERFDGDLVGAPASASSYRIGWDLAEGFARTYGAALVENRFSAFLGESDVEMDDRVYGR